MPDTIFTKDMNEINKFFSKNKKMIIKPIHSFSGNDIHLFQNKINAKLITNFIKNMDILCVKSFYLKLSLEIKEFL